MKKKYAAILAAAAMTLSVLFLGGCGETSVQIDRVLPWDMPELYEYSEFKVERKLVSETDLPDTVLAEGKTTFTLERAHEADCIKLTVTAVLTYNNENANGIDKGLTDSMTSEVLFSDKTLLPLSSKKTVVSAQRESSENLSYEITVDYKEDSATLKWTKSNKEPMQRKIKASGQVFDNEQLFFVMRAFAGLNTSSRLSFKLYQPFQSFVYNHGVYTMGLSVAGEKTERILSGWQSDRLYGMETDEESGKPKTECYATTLSIAEDKSGPPIIAYYSANPFVIQSPLNTYKVLVGFTETSYGATLSDTTKTEYTLINYRAAARPSVS